MTKEIKKEIMKKVYIELKKGYNWEEVCKYAIDLALKESKKQK